MAAKVQSGMHVVVCAHTYTLAHTHTHARDTNTQCETYIKEVGEYGFQFLIT